MRTTGTVAWADRWEPVAESFFRSEYLLVPFEIGVALGLRVQIEATGES